ncbi:hypothetical protein SAICODRAFT_81080 [Saitoella complicata NRRL Y-17804]|uniref:uncharacterized protein n=1 Tax=Saitoella complicata (strain BCRC 22490 / CBS 7301 / JCM 7358 / NBRC 10748 / NRRL Y-17804) TaxID=698492 RepID=UPI000866BE62|nr:uncharacterized protein SAICODRAFT_81080 [Saitoella complicata NRRL Y-17804]ODQ52450.1 hypothetical protein SAICODRAFT_81080 [Saitoella complicata NRRL Y-17804]
MTWQTIESDPGVFTQLISDLGAKDIQVEELYAIDKDLISQYDPIYGVIFLFKWGKEHGEQSAQGGTLDENASTSLWFAHQTIQNACGTQAILSILLNNPGIELGEKLDGFKDFTREFPPEIRGDALTNSEVFARVHNSFARVEPWEEEERKPKEGEEGEAPYHFIAYVPVDGTLFELDGLKPAPVNHGPVAGSSSAEFADALIPVLERRISTFASTSIEFSLLALTKDLRLSPFATEETRMEEEEKRKRWAREQELRQHSFLPLVMGLVKEVVKRRVAEGKSFVQEDVMEQ